MSGQEGITTIIEENHSRLIEWENNNTDCTKIDLILPSKIGAVKPPKNRMIESGTLMMEIIVSFLLLSFTSAGLYIVVQSEPNGIPSPIGWFLIIVSIVFLIGLNYGYILHFNEDRKRISRVMGYYTDSEYFFEVTVFQKQLKVRKWLLSNIHDFVINNIDEENRKLDRVVNIVFFDMEGKIKKRKLFRVSSDQISAANNFLVHVNSLHHIKVQKDI